MPRNLPRLPRRRAPASSVAPVAPTKGCLSDTRVLVVEDDEVTAKLFALLVREQGAIVKTVATAEEAFVELATEPPDLVLLDLVLPRMSGLLLLEVLRDAGLLDRAAIVAVTSIHGPGTEAIVREAGCDGYLLKPIDAGTFARSIADELARWRAA
jgi:two-component system cell cycle response regulator DivK